MAKESKGYMGKILAASNLAKPGKIYVTKILHDDWCEKLKGGECNCDPEIKMVEVN